LTDSRRILITGAGGQLGQAFADLDWRGFTVRFIDLDDLDLGDAAAIEAYVEQYAPDIVINTAAYTAVDKAESEPELVDRINHQAPAAFARILAKTGGLLLHYSTDYVFPGDGEKPYREDDTTGPASIYGSTKLAGEQAVTESGCDYLIFRTSWVYAFRGQNFLLTMLRLAESRDELTVVDDQHGTPTYAEDLAVLSQQVLLTYLDRGDAGLNGIYHLGNLGQTTWCGFAREIMQKAGKPTRVIPVGSEAYPTPAKRPAYSVLDKNKVISAFGLEIPDWKDALERCLGRLA